MQTRTSTGVRAGALAIGVLASVACADLTPEVFRLHASVGGMDGSYTVYQDDGYFDDDGNFFWDLEGDVEIKGDNGDILATLSGASVSIYADPIISMNFNVQASNQNTIFTVGSGLLSFPEIQNAIGAASAGVTVTDVNGNGATLSPDGPSMYLSHYNGEIPNGTLFTRLLDSSLSAGAFQSNATSEEYPGGGNYAAIGDPVLSMSAAWTFTLSALDLASGTSTFVVIPAPAGVALLGVAGLAAMRRRR